MNGSDGVLEGKVSTLEQLQRDRVPLTAQDFGVLLSVQRHGSPALQVRAEGVQRVEERRRDRRERDRSARDATRGAFSGRDD